MAVQDRNTVTAHTGHDDTAASRPTEQNHGQVSPWEWLMAALGLVLVAVTIGFMLYQAFSASDAPPQVDLRIDSIQPAGTSYLVTFTATNRGSSTAADLVIEATLGDDSGTMETSTATLAYLPPGSSREGGLYFTQNPRQYRLELRPKGYEQP